MSQHHTNSRNMRKVSAEFRAQCEEADAECWLCHQGIDYTLPSGQGLEEAFERDHYYPASTHPQFYEDPANFRPSHGGCNRDRSNNAPTAELGPLSEAWF